MPPKTWKNVERRVAKIFAEKGYVNAKRNPLSGGTNVDDKGSKRYGDIIGTPFHIEVKHRKEFNKIYKTFGKFKGKDVLLYSDDLVCVELNFFLHMWTECDIWKLFGGKIVFYPIKFPKYVHSWFEKASKESGERVALLVLHPKGKKKFYVITNSLLPVTSENGNVSKSNGRYNEN